MPPNGGFSLPTIPRAVLQDVGAFTRRPYPHTEARQIAVPDNDLVIRAGLTNDSARDAYLQSVVTAGYIASHTDVEGRRRLLQRIGDGFSIDQALHEVMGLDSDGLDSAVRNEIRAEFPEWGLPLVVEADLP